MANKAVAARHLIDLLNGVLIPVDQLFLCDGSSSFPPLFIVGAPRSGTTLTYQIITQQICCTYLPRSVGYLYGLPNLSMRLLKPRLGRPMPVFNSSYGRIRGLMSPGEHGGFWFRWFPRDGEQGNYVEPHEVAIEKYEDLRQTIDSMSRIIEKPLVFKNVYLSMAVGVLAQIFPEARFILVRRERLFTCQSLLLARLKRSDPNDWWSVKPPQYRQLRKLPLWQQVTDQVYYTESVVQHDLEHYASGRYLQWRYEDVCLNPIRMIDVLKEWLRPLGYVAYRDIRIPKTFELSSKIVLSKEDEQNIKNRLHYLEQGQGYCSPL